MRQKLEGSYVTNMYCLIGILSWLLLVMIHSQIEAVSEFDDYMFISNVA